MLKPENKIRPILVGGMPQSGSTLCFNIYRLLLSQFGVSVYKHHTWYRNVHLNHFCIVTYRDVRDTVTSNIRRRRVEFTEAEVLNTATLHINEYFIPWTHYIDAWNGIYWKYEDYKTYRELYILETCRKIGIDVNIRQIQGIIERAENLKDHPDIPAKDSEFLEQDQKKFLTQTALTKEHITSNGKIGAFLDHMPLPFIKVLEDRCGNWLDEYGYYRMFTNESSAVPARVF